MDSRDFRQWWDYHRGAYPGLAAWAKNNPDQLEHWERILKQTTLPQAKSATDSLVATDEQPKGYGEHPRWIRRIAMAASGGDVETYEKRQEGPRVKDDQLVADCPRCMDFGIVSVLSPDCLKRLWKNDASKGLTTCVIACDCELGRRKSRTLRVPQYQSGHALFRADDVRELAIDERDKHPDFTAAEWAAARKMLGEFDAQRHTHPDFADYGPKSEMEF